MLIRLIAISACLALYQTQNSSNSTAAACHEVFPNCRTCDSKLTTCLECNSGYFKLQPKPEDTSLSLCVVNCDIFNSHFPLYGSRSCELDCPRQCGSNMCGSGKSCTNQQSTCSGSFSFLAPDGQCTDFACPHGYYRDASNKSCGHCDSSCSKCAGPTEEECISCPAGAYLSLPLPQSTKGKCVSKSSENSEFTILVSNAVSIISNGNTASQRTGQFNNPFVDVRDALRRAQELASAYTTSSVTILLTKGTHYVLLEEEAQRYRAYPQHQTSYSLTIKPLPCGLNPSLDSACVPHDEKVLVINKIGAYLHLNLPQQTKIERLHFDFADSLLEWGSSCQKRRTRSCSVLRDSNDATVVTSLDPDCECRSAVISALTCNYNHELAFLNSPLPHSSNLPSDLTLTQIQFTNVYERFNSLIGFDSQAPPNLVVQDSEFQSISICGPVVSPTQQPPLDPTDTISLSFTRHVFDFYPSNGSAIKIIGSLFKKIGLALQYQDASSLKASLYSNAIYDMTAAILALKSVHTKIEIRGSYFADNKLNFDPTIPIDASEGYIFQNSILIQKMGLLEQALIVVRNHTQGILLQGNRFERNSGLRGLVLIEMGAAYAKSSVLFNNTFSRSSGLIRAGVLNLRSKYQENEPRSCSGFHVEQNKITRTVLLKGDASIIYMACIYDDFTQFDDISDISGIEYLSTPQLKSVPPLLTHEEQYNFNSFQLIVEYSKTVFKNNILAENLRIKNCGSMVVALFMRQLIIQDLSLIRNGDINLMTAYHDKPSFWADFGGLHKSLHFLDLEFEQVQMEISDGFKDKILILGSIESLLIDGVYALDNWFWEQNGDSLGQFITAVHSQSLIRNVEAISFHSGENLALFDYIKSEHLPISLDFKTSAEHLKASQLQGNLIYANSCQFQEIRVENQSMSHSLFSGVGGTICRIEGLSLYNVNINRIIASINPTQAYLIGGHFQIVRFSSAFDSLHSEMRDVYYSNAALQTSNPVNIFFDFISSGIFAFRNVTLDNLCGNSTCSNNLFISNTVGKFEFYGLKVIGYRSQISNILRIMGGYMYVKDSYFEANQAPYGVIVKFVGSGNVQIDNSYFYDNRGQASTLFAMSAQGQLTVRKSTLISNKAVNGGAVIGYSGRGTFLFQECEFSNNQAASGSILQGLSDDLNVQNTFRKCSFSGNTGSATFYAFIMNLEIDACHFSHNFDNQGESSPIYISGSRVQINRSFFSNKQVLRLFSRDAAECRSDSVNRGGFIYDVTGNDVQIQSSVFQEVCAKDGGAIFLSGISKTWIKSSVFRNCKSLEGGGAIHAKNFAKLQIIDTQFEKNQAVIGSDIYALDSSEMLALLNSEIKSSLENPIYLGKTGANITNNSFSNLTTSLQQSVIGSVQTKKLILQGNLFKEIETGSVLQLQERAEGNMHLNLVRDNSFQNVKAWKDGGAIQAREAGPLNIQLNFFNQVILLKTEGKGGALYIDQRTDQPIEITENRFVGCYADLSGAIHWVYRGPLLQQNSFESVSAKYYAPQIGSYGKQISFIPSDIGEELSSSTPQIFSLQGETKIAFEGLRSGAQLPSVYAGVMDQYNQIVTDANGGVVYSSVREIVKGNETMSKYIPLLSDTNQNVWTNGAIKINNLKLIGEPGRSYQVLFTSPIIDSSLPAVQDFLRLHSLNKIQISLQLGFRLCESGQEFLPEGECRKCEPSFYLLEAPRSPTACKPCLENAICYGGNQIGPARGYWRSHASSETISPCFNFNGCLGTQPQESYDPQGTCGKGYTGKLCGTCEQGYTRNTRYQCNQCPEPYANFLILFGLLVLFVSIFVIAIKCSLRSALKKKSLFTVYFKILVNHLQVLMLISSFDFDWPNEVQAFLAASKTVTDSPQQLFSIDCLVQSSIGRPFKRFYIYSLIYFVLPLICASLSYLFWRIKYYQNNRVMWNKLIATLFIIFFLIHPSVTRVILQLFDCHKIDGTPYLKEQLSEQCWSGDQLRFSMTVGLLGILLWSVGIPILSAYLLRRNRKKLEEPAIKEKFGFLYNGYSLRSYYWETFMSLRKVLIAFISIFLTSQGTMLQSLVLFIVLIVSIFINFKVNPYNERKINRLEIISLIALIVTVYCGIFFLSARNPSKLEYIRGKDFTLSQSKKWLLFLAIILSNGLFAGLWLFRLVLEVKIKLLKRFPRCYNFFCLCRNRRKLMREQQVAVTSEKNKKLIIRLEEIRYELGTYIDKLDSNEHLIEMNLLDEMANDFKGTLEHIKDWRENQRSIIKESKLRVVNTDLRKEGVQSQDDDTLESGLSTRRPLRQNRKSLPFFINGGLSLQKKHQFPLGPKISQLSSPDKLTNGITSEAKKPQSFESVEVQSLPPPEETDCEVNYLEFNTERKVRRPSLFQRNPVAIFKAKEEKGFNLEELDDDQLDLDSVEEEFKLSEGNREQKNSIITRGDIPWSQFIENPTNEYLNMTGRVSTTKMKRRKSNMHSHAALFTKLALNKDDSF